MNEKDKIECIGLTSPDLEIRVAFAENKEILLTEEQIEFGLTDSSPIVRYIIAKRFINSEYKALLLSNSQIERGIKDENDRVRALFMQYNDLFVLDENVDTLLKDESLETKLALAKNIYISFTDEQLKVGLSSPIDRVRTAFSKKAMLPNKINKNKVRNSKFLLTDSSPSVRNSFLILNPVMSDYERERTFIDSDPNIRLSSLSVYTYLTHKSLYYFNRRQIDRGLKDGNIGVRYAWLEKVIEDNLGLTNKQIDELLNDRCVRIRLAIVKAENITLTKQQINMATCDSCYIIRCAIVDRKDIFLSSEQIDNGLTDENEIVRSSFMCRYVKILNEKQVTRALNDSYSRVRFLASTFVDFFTPEQIEIGLGHIDKDVRLFFSQKRSFIPDVLQVKRGLVDDYCNVRLAFVNRRDITLTPEQIKSLSLDSDFNVKNAVKKRKEYMALYNRSKPLKTIK